MPVYHRPVTWIEVYNDSSGVIEKLRRFLSDNRLFPLKIGGHISPIMFSHGFEPEVADRIIKFLNDIKPREVNVKNGATVIINGDVPKWEGTKGKVLDRIPDTDWYNVEVEDANGDKLRLALRSDEFNTE